MKYTAFLLSLLVVRAVAVCDDKNLPEPFASFLQKVCNIALKIAIQLGESTTMKPCVSALFKILDKGKCKYKMCFHCLKASFYLKRSIGVEIFRKSSFCRFSLDFFLIFRCFFA